MLKAIQDDDLSVAKELLEALPDLANSRNAHHNTPMSVALQVNNVAAAKLLLEYGADPNHRNHGGHALLDGAAFSGCPEIARLLISAGAKPNVLHLAALGDLDALKPLVTNRAGRASEEAMRLRRAGGRWRMNALHAAARAANEHACALLLDIGFDPNIGDHNGHTPLSLAIENGDDQRVVACAERLIGAGADVNASAGHYGGTVLHRCIATGRVPLVELLLERGSDPNRTDHAGKTALYQSVGKTQRLVTLVLAKSPDLTVRSNAGETALEYAKRLKKTGIVKLLVSAQSSRDEFDVGQT